MADASPDELFPLVPAESAGSNDVVSWNMTESDDYPVIQMLTGDRYIRAFLPKGKKKVAEVFGLLMEGGDPAATLANHKKVSNLTVIPLAEVTEVGWVDKRDDLKLSYPNAKGKVVSATMSQGNQIARGEMRDRLLTIKGASPESASVEAFSTGGIVFWGLLKALGALALGGAGAALAASDGEVDGNGRGARKARGLVNIARMIGPIPIFLIAAAIAGWILFGMARDMKTPPQRHTIAFD